MVNSPTAKASPSPKKLNFLTERSASQESSKSGKVGRPRVKPAEDTEGSAPPAKRAKLSAAKNEDGTKWKIQANGKSSKKKGKTAVLDQEYEVEKILAVGGTGKQRKFLVKWVGWPKSQSTWEPEAHLKGNAVLIRFLGTDATVTSTVQEAEEESEEEEEAPVKKTEKKSSQKKVTTAGRKKVSAVDKEYEVERILDVKSSGKQRQFLVKWVGWPKSQSTWEPEGHLEGNQILKQFLEQERPTSSRSDKDEKEKSQVKPKKAVVKSTTPVKSVKVTTEYEVESILDSQTSGKGRQLYLVKWVGWPKSQSTWEPEAHLKGNKILARYLENENKTGPKKASPNKQKDKKVKGGGKPDRINGN